MSKSLEGKIALVTGGSRGIGAAIAKRLAADGAKVALTYTKGADAAAAVVKEIEAAGGKAIAIQADATDAEANRAGVEKAVKALGRLDVFVNNAGTAIPKPFEEATLEELDHVININIRGLFIATQAALKHMNDGGRIIVIGSCVGERNMTPGPRRMRRPRARSRCSPRACRGRSAPAKSPSTHPAGSDRHRPQSRFGRLGHAAKGQYRAQPLWNGYGDCRPGGVRRQSGGSVHHRRQPDGRWRHQRLIEGLTPVVIVAR